VEIVPNKALSLSPGPRRGKTGLGTELISVA
jgi:hypothetical protein